MPIYWISIAAETGEEIIISGEAQKLYAELDIAAALSAAGWIIAGVSAWWDSRGQSNPYPTTVDGISFAWACMPLEDGQKPF